MTPIGSSARVVTVTLSHIAHKDDTASPRKPNDDTVARSSNEDSFEVWCFRPAILVMLLIWMK